MITWKMFSESKPLFSDFYLVKNKNSQLLGEYGVCYYSQEYKSFGELASYYDAESNEEVETFIPHDGVVAWTSFQRIDEEHKEKTAEQMFNDLDYKKRIKDECIEFKRHTERIDEGLIEFDLALKTVYVSWFREPKDITIAELRAINKQCEELGWI